MEGKQDGPWRDWTAELLTADDHHKTVDCKQLNHINLWQIIGVFTFLIIHEILILKWTSYSAQTRQPCILHILSKNLTIGLYWGQCGYFPQCTPFHMYFKDKNIAWRLNLPDHQSVHRFSVFNLEIPTHCAYHFCSLQWEEKWKMREPVNKQRVFLTGNSNWPFFGPWSFGIVYFSTIISTSWPTSYLIPKYFGREYIPFILLL